MSNLLQFLLFRSLSLSHGLFGMSRHQVQVPLGSLDPLVPEIALDRLNVYTVHQPLGGPEVPQVMKSSNPTQAGHLSGACNPVA